MQTWLWSILQKFRWFELICKHYFMHKVKSKLVFKEKLIHLLIVITWRHTLTGSVGESYF